MGIHGLSAFLKKRYPSLFATSKISNIKGEKVAIDANLYIYKYKSIYGENWIDGMIYMLCSLKRNGVIPVLVFDGQSPELKKETREKRKDVIETNRQRYEVLQEALDDYKDYGKPSNILIATSQKKKNNNELKSLLLGKHNDEVIDVAFIESECTKLKNQGITFDELDIPGFKQILDIMHVPYIQAKCEGELLCAKLVKEKIVKAVLSEDSDLLAYNCSFIIKKYDVRTGEIMAYSVDDVLEAMNFTYDQFVDFCILCGTDYNKNIPNVGPVTSFNLIEKHKRLEDIDIKDVNDLNYEIVRSIFKNMEICGTDINICVKQGIPTELESNYYTNKFSSLILEAWKDESKNEVIKRVKLVFVG